MKPRIIIHIGHGKTGTSFIQSVLAKNHSLLKENGILYPFHPSFRRAEKGHISSGNLPVVPLDDGASPDWLTERVIHEVEKNHGYGSYIFSSEHIFWHMDMFNAGLPRYRDSFDFHIILCVREPVELIASAWHQRIKRHGYSKSFEDFLNELGHSCVHTRTSSLILEGLDKINCSYSLLNYSCLGTQIGSQLLDAMDIGSIIDIKEDNQIVNRSLTHAELQMTAFVNSILGASAGQAVADALVNHLPQIKAEKPAISHESLKALQENMQDYVASINRRLPKESWLQWGQAEENYVPFFQLGSSQVEIAREKTLAWFKQECESASPCIYQRTVVQHSKTKKLRKRMKRLRFKLDLEKSNRRSSLIERIGQNARKIFRGLGRAISRSKWGHRHEQQ